MQIIPKTGFKGLVENWQSDMLAAVSVSLVALPLGLGIALASGVPPMAGITSAIIGGLVTTLYRGSHVAINGPAAGLIAVVLASIIALDDGSGKALNYVFAAIMVSGGIQVLLGLFRLGKFADLFHSTVIHGILAAIGVIIFAKQIHVALGLTATTTGIFETIIDAFKQIPNANPFVLSISLVGLFILFFHSKISYKFFHWLPAPMWVLVFALPFVYLFNYVDGHTYHLFNREYSVGPDLLIKIPDSILDSIMYPDFSKIATLPFWTSVLSITMIASIESLASAKAIDKLDPYKRKTNLNKDLIGIGLSTMASGAIGGLPIINVIVRSTVNVHNNAKTKWSNFYHGLLLLAFIFILTPVIQKVPLCALASLLVFTGYKLASPKVFKHVYDQGIEQLIFFVGTLIITLLTDLLVGIFGGLLLALITHMLMAKLPVSAFFKHIFKSGSTVDKGEDGSYILNVRGIANFLNTIQIEKLLESIPEGANVKIDLAQARLVDYSIMEHLYDFQRVHGYSKGNVEIAGLDRHTSSSTNKMAMKINTKDLQRLTARQQALQVLAWQKVLGFELTPANNLSYLQSFYFFKSRPILRKYDKIFGKDENANWEVVDVTFQEGALLAAEEYDTTLGLIRFPFRFPKFVIEQKLITERLINFSAHKDIDYVLYYGFSDNFIVKVEDTDEMSAFLNKEIKQLIEQSELIHHIESNGEAVLLFMDNMRMAQIEDYEKILSFTYKLMELISARNIDPHVTS